MINFRYHIVSLMAVFLALSVGIVIGVTLRPSVDEGLAQQAAQDRKQVQELRTELDQRNTLDDYRDAYAARASSVIAGNVLSGARVAVVDMPDAPGGVADSIVAAVTQAGGSVTRTAKINKNVFDPTKAEQLNRAVAPYAGQLQITDATPVATKFGLALGRAMLSRQTAERDVTATAITKALTSAGLVSIDDNSTAQAQLVIVVTAQATDPRPLPDVVTAHVQLDLAFKSHGLGVVVAGPNSANIDGTDVLAVRNDSSTADVLSTVDVADLSSGVTTTILAGKEQLNGHQGHYGALSDADAPAPALPVR